MKCSNCNNPINKDDNYCKSCGQKITGQENKGLAIASIVLGILSIIVGFLFIPFGIIGLILGLNQKGKSTEKTTGIILNIVGIVISILVWAFLFSAAFRIGRFLFNYIEDRGVTDIFNDEVVSDNSFLERRLESFTNWKLFKGYRSGILAKEDSLIGGWRKLDSSKEYWVFKEKEFYVYNDLNQRDDNYIYGTYKVIKLEDSDIDMDRVEATISDSDNVITKDDFYYIELQEEGNVFAGIKEKLEKPQEFTRLMIIIDHGEEGYEGLLYNLDKNTRTYFVKLED